MSESALEKILSYTQTSAGAVDVMENGKLTLTACEGIKDAELLVDNNHILGALKSKKTILLSVEQAEQSTSLEEFELEIDQKYAVIFGNEVKGVQQEVVDASDFCLEIPQYGTKHSLNISVSCGHGHNTQAPPKRP